MNFVMPAIILSVVIFFCFSVSSFANVVTPNGSRLLYSWDVLPPSDSAVYIQDGVFRDDLDHFKYSAQFDWDHQTSFLNNAFLGGNGPDGYSNYYLFVTSRIGASFILKNQEIIRSTYLDPAKVSFTNISTKLSKLDDKVGKMDPLIISQSISFLIGAFMMMAFVLAVHGKRS